MLTLVDLTQNSIRRIGDLSAHRFLECLLLAKNNLSWVEGLQNLRFLQVTFSHILASTPSHRSL